MTELELLVAESATYARMPERHVVLQFDDQATVFGDNHGILEATDAGGQLTLLGRLERDFGLRPLIGAERVAMYDLRQLDIVVFYTKNGAARGPRELMQRLHGESGAAYRLKSVGLNAPVRLMGATVGDPLRGEQWALDRVDADRAWAKARAAAARAPMGPPTSPVKIAIVDSGVMRGHEDLGYPTMDGIEIGAVSSWFVDEDGHGTRLAGTIGAISRNGRGVAGAPTAPPLDPPLELFVAKFLDARTPPHAVAGAVAILAATAAGAKVVNVSWDIGLDVVGRPPFPLGWLRQTLEIVARQDVVLVVAAGNDGTDNTILPTLPASFALPNMITVMGSDEIDDAASFSNFGNNVDLAAPAKRILSTVPYFDLSGSTTVARPGVVNRGYSEYSGTSAATAHVTAAVALLLGLSEMAEPGGAWRASEVRGHLLASVDPVPRLSGLCLSGGRLNAGRLVAGPLSLSWPPPVAEDSSAILRIMAGARLRVQWEMAYETPEVASIDVALICDGDPRMNFILPNIPASSKETTLQVPLWFAGEKAHVEVTSRKRRLFSSASQSFIVL